MKRATSLGTTSTSVKAVPSQQNVYTSFAGLVDAMKRNMAGNYVLGADLDASEVNLAPADYVYLKGNFTGSLTGSQMASNMRFTI